MKFSGGPLEGYISPPEQDAEIGEEWTFRGLDAKEHTYRRDGDHMTFVESADVAPPAIAVPDPEPAFEPQTVPYLPGEEPAPEPEPEPKPATDEPLPEEQPAPSDDRQASDAPE